jgi:hypothetical protein
MSESVTMTASVIQLSPSSFQYTLTLDDVGPTTIGGLWIAWAPGFFFLPHAPTVSSAPAGWTATQFGNSVQFAASSTADYVQSGGTLTGFSFTVPDPPSVVLAPGAPGTAVLTSFAYKTSAIDGPSDFGSEFVVACFAAGTRILTAGGEVAVEGLGADDAVPTLTGARQTPVRWLGHTRIDCRHHPRPPDVWPVRIAPGALGAGRPARPLRLSPDHAVHLDGSLVPARRLINGATIVQEHVEQVEYWHLELPAHAVLVADGLPVESYLDTGNRAAFARSEQPTFADAVA